MRTTPSSLEHLNSIKMKTVKYYGPPGTGKTNTLVQEILTKHLAEGIKPQDVEGTNDLYVRAFFDSNDSKETDTHYRCTTGKGSFNYRLLFNIQHPRKDQNYNLTLQLYDRDFFKSNDLIGDSVLNI